MRDMAASRRDYDRALEGLIGARGRGLFCEAFAHRVATRCAAHNITLTPEADDNLRSGVQAVMLEREAAAWLYDTLDDLAEEWAEQFGDEAAKAAQQAYDDWQAGIAKAQQPTQPALAGGGE